MPRGINPRGIYYRNTIGKSIVLGITGLAITRYLGIDILAIIVVILDVEENGVGLHARAWSVGSALQNLATYNHDTATIGHIISLVGIFIKFGNYARSGLYLVDALFQCAGGFEGHVVEIHIHSGLCAPVTIFHPHLGDVVGGCIESAELEDTF